MWGIDLETLFLYLSLWIWVKNKISNLHNLVRNILLSGKFIDCFDIKLTPYNRFYSHFWSFFWNIYVHLSQKWSSAGHFLVLNRSKFQFFEYHSCFLLRCQNSLRQTTLEIKHFSGMTKIYFHQCCPCNSKCPH